MDKLNILLLFLPVLLIQNASSFPTNGGVRSTVSKSAPEYSSVIRMNRQLSPEIPHLTSRLFQEYQNSQNAHHQILKSGNIDLYSNRKLAENLYLIAARFVNSVERTVSLLSDNNDNHGGTARVIQYTYPSQSVTNKELTVKETTDNQFSAIAVKPAEKTYLKYAPGYEYESNAQTTENYKLTDEDIRRNQQEGSGKIEDPHRKGFSKDDVNEEVKKIDFISDLTAPDEESVNIFVTNNQDDLQKFRLNLTEIPLPNEDSLNVFLLNSNSNIVHKSSQKLNPNVFSSDNPNIFKLIYNYPLPTAEPNLNFKTGSSQIFENFETSTSSSFRTDSSVQLKIQSSNFELPENTNPGNLKLFLPSKNTFNLENDENVEDKIVKKGATPDYSSLSEIPLEESPVFDLNKMSLINSYGRRVSKFRRHTKN